MNTIPNTPEKKTECPYCKELAPKKCIHHKIMDGHFTEELRKVEEV